MVAPLALLRFRDLDASRNSACSPLMSENGEEENTRDDLQIDNFKYNFSKNYKI